MSKNENLQFAENYWAGQVQPDPNDPTTPKIVRDPASYMPLRIPELPEMWIRDEPVRPVVALDIDGVLNPESLDGTTPEGYIEQEVVLPMWAAATSHFLVGKGQRNSHTRIVYNPKHGEWINSLLEKGVDVVWCTSWESIAPVVWNELLDIPPLPVVVLPFRLPRMREHFAGANAKAQRLDQLFMMRPLVWLDDQSTHYRGGWRVHWSTRNELVPTLVPSISGYTGLTQEVMDEVDTWIQKYGYNQFYKSLKILTEATYGHWRVKTEGGTFDIQIVDHDPDDDYMHPQTEWFKASRPLARKLGVTDQWTTEFSTSQDDNPRTFARIRVGEDLKLRVWEAPDTEDIEDSEFEVQADLGRVVSIDLVRPMPDEYWEGMGKQLEERILRENDPEDLELPDLFERHALQIRAQEVAAKIPGVLDVGVRDNVLYYADAFTVATAQFWEPASDDTDGGEQLNVQLRWRLPSSPAGLKWESGMHYVDATPQTMAPGGTVNPDVALPYLIEVVRDWIRESFSPTNGDDA